MAKSLKSIDDLKNSLQGEYGKKSVMYASELEKYKVFSSGSIGLDYATGIGGFPSNRVIEIAGEPGAGKSTTALHAVNNRLHAEVEWGTNRGALYLDIENRMTPDWLENFVDFPDRVIVAKPDSVEQATDIYRDAVRSGQIGIVVFDSIGGAPTERVTEKSASIGNIGGNALAVTRFANLASTLSGKYDVTTIGINQIRDDLSGFHRLNCLSGDTMVLTKKGWKPIESLAGTTQTILTEGSKWVEAPFDCYGEDEMWEIEVERYGVHRTIKANASHRWPVYRIDWMTQPKDKPKANHELSDGCCTDRDCQLYGKCHCDLCELETTRPNYSREENGIFKGEPLQFARGHRRANNRGHSRQVRQFVTTENLIPGIDRLLVNHPKFEKQTLTKWAVASGFVFGDGTKSNQGPRGSFSISKNTCPKANMADYFDMFNVTETDDKIRISGYPNYMKDKPSLDDGPDFLYGWLAGYFAADGSVSKSDGIPVMTSGFRDNLELVQDVCAVLGFATNEIAVRKYNNNSFAVSDEYYEMTFPVGTFPREFYLNTRHSENYKEPSSTAPQRWNVVSVRNTGVVEPIYCANVPQTETFTIGGYILSGNTPGGRAWQHACSLRVELKVRRQAGDKAYRTMNDGSKEQTGYVVSAKIHKNSLGAPFKAVWWWFHNVPTDENGFGIDQRDELSRLALATGVITKKDGGNMLYNDALPNGKVNGRTGFGDLIRNNNEVYEEIKRQVLEKLRTDNSIAGVSRSFDDMSVTDIDPFQDEDVSAFMSAPQIDAETGEILD